MSEQVLENLRKDSFLQRLVVKKKFWLFFVFLFFAYPLIRSFYRTLPAPLPVLGTVPTFNFTNEKNQPFGSENLKGKVYLASFFFLNCPSTCPKILKTVQTIQRRVRGLGGNFMLVSFTVDPEHDIPEKLQKRAHELQAASHVWSFLTSDKASMQSLLVDGFKVPMGEKSMESLYDIAHTQKLVLVDSKGHIRGYYGIETDDINKLMIDVGLLVNREYFEKNNKEKDHG
ncbi:MAG: SCO family protein [Bacteriovoracaceae bacterium]|nr:SCO family protein [Bacteriovoracaceae bacterium]